MNVSSASTPFVRVHIWEHPLFQGKGKQTLGFYSPGHVALEVHCGGLENRIIYISFWPPTHKCCAASAAHFHQYQTDKDYEKKDSETFDVVLNDEGITKILAAFEKFKSNPYGWSALGSSFFRRSYESNCAGLSLYLLEKGGMQRGSGSSAKAIVAAASSLVILGGVSLYSYSRIRTLEKASEVFGEFLKGLVNLRSIHAAALDYFRDLENGLLDKIVKVHDNEKKWCESVVLLRDIQPLITFLLFNEGNSAMLYLTLRRIASLTKKQIRIAKTALLFPLALAGIGLFINQKIWLKTVTPSDVKKIVAKSSKKQTLVKKTEVQEIISSSSVDLKIKESSFVTLWIWKQMINQNVAAVYQHTALETHTGGNGDKTTYMSLWSSHQHSESCNTGDTPHFHVDKRIDEELLGEASTQYSLFLNVQKMNAAFEKLKKNPSSTSNLEWGILSRSYSLNASSISTLLLEKGGRKKETQPFASALKTVSVCGIALAGINYFTARELAPVANDSYFYGAADSYMQTVATTTCSKVMLDEVAKFGTEFLAKIKGNPILETLYQNELRIVNQEDGHRVMQFIYAILSTKEELLKISKYALATSIGALSLYYLCNRLVSEDYSYSALERLAKSVEKAQVKKMYHLLNNPSYKKRTYVAYVGGAVLVASLAAYLWREN